MNVGHASGFTARGTGQIMGGWVGREYGPESIVCSMKWR